MTSKVVLHVEQPNQGRHAIAWPEGLSLMKIGTLRSAQVRVHGRGVARVHAVMERSAEELMVVDLGSPGGTKVNGADTNKARLVDGDIVTIGDCTYQTVMIEFAQQFDDGFMRATRLYYAPDLDIVLQNEIDHDFFSETPRITTAPDLISADPSLHVPR